MILKTEEEEFKLILNSVVLKKRAWSPTLSPVKMFLIVVFQ